MTTKAYFLTGAVAAVAAIGMAHPARATIAYDQNVTNMVIYGSGNGNGSFTTDRSGGVELGLRTKTRFNASGQPENTFNSNGDGTYSYAAGQPAVGGFGWAPGSASTATWNFDWSINSNYDGSTGLNLDDLSYEIGIDFDPGIGTNFMFFDPITGGIIDNSIGTNATGQGQGVEAANAGQYATLIANNNLAQNSWNMEFFDGGSFAFDANVDGTYDFVLSAFSGATQIASVNIQVIVGAGAPPGSAGGPAVAEPVTAALFGMAFVGLGAVRRRQRR